VGRDVEVPSVLLATVRGNSFFLSETIPALDFITYSIILYDIIL
jgi:hypothetical protein